MRLLLSLVFAARVITAPASAKAVPTEVAVESRGPGNPFGARDIAKRSFVDSCGVCNLLDSRTMKCQCAKDDHTLAWSTLDLNNCIGNIGGWLTWGKEYAISHFVCS
jgi:hypothetical protein